MEIPTSHSIATLGKLLFVTEPWFETVFSDPTTDVILGSLVKRPGKRHEALYEAAFEERVKRGFTTIMGPYREHERIVRDSLESLVEDRFVLIDPVAFEDRSLGIEPHSPRNGIVERMRSAIDRGRVFSVGPLLVPFDLADGRIELPLEGVLPERFAQVEPWAGYYRFNPRLFDERGDPFDRDSIAHASAHNALARSMLAVRARAIDDARSGERDEIRIFAFSSGVLNRALDAAPRLLIRPERYKQVGGRVSSGRANDELGIANDGALGKLAAYFGTALESTPIRNRTRTHATPTYPWLAEPYPGGFEQVVDVLSRRYGEPLIDRFSELMRERGWRAEHALPRLTQLPRLRIADAQRHTVALEELVEAIGPSSFTRGEAQGVRITPSDAITTPFDCPLAHHIADLESAERLALMRSRIGTLPDVVREGFLEYRDDELRSLWPRFGQLAHDIYTYPWVLFSSDYGSYGAMHELFERSLNATIEREGLEFALKSRPDVMLEGHAKDGSGIVPIIIDRKLASSTESMRHSHRLQLALDFAAYRQRIEESGATMPYAIGIIDASAPHYPHPSGYRPQRHTARLFTNDEIDEGLERSIDVALRRDAITHGSVREERDRSAAYRIGPNGGRAAPLCMGCGVYRADGLVRGSLATRLVCDALVTQHS